MIEIVLKFAFVALVLPMLWWLLRRDAEDRSMDAWEWYCRNIH